jgi:hypothetical protein
LDWKTRVTHAVPADQPEGVAQVAQRLFPAYCVDGGRIHLAGCTLDERLYARLRYQAGETVVGIFVDSDGQELSATEADALGLVDVAPVPKPPPTASIALARFIAHVVPGLERRTVNNQHGELVSVTLVWCKFAEGKLRFTIGEESVDLPFADWARTLQPPPYACPFTGARTFHLAATDDGRIVPVEQLVACDETGRRTLASDLVECTVTGKHVMPELTRYCPVTGKAVLSSALIACEMCGQEVSPATLTKGRCGACRSLRPVDKADPRMARLLDVHPALDQWSGWRVAETATCCIFTAAGWVQLLLVVVDRETLEVKRLATGSRLTSDWQLVNPEQYPFVLHE